MGLHPETIHWLEGAFPGRVILGEPMRRHTSFRVGGPADALVTAATAESLGRLVRGCRERGVPHTVIGGGTNLLVRDGGIRGVVIRLKTTPRAVACRFLADGRTALEVPAGVATPALCALAVARGLAGLGFAVGIPGTVGGALRMNAGTRAGQMAGILETLTVLDPEGRIHRIGREFLRPGHRSLSWDEAGAGCRREGAVILAGRLVLGPGEPRALKAEARAAREARRRSQPAGVCSAGCFFKNPPQGPGAGELIDRAGLKGLRVGGACVSARHANFIVNENGASAGDILALAEMVRERVNRMFQILLEPEVEILGT